MTITLSEIVNALENLADMMVSAHMSELAGYNMSFWRDAASVVQTESERLDILELFVSGDGSKNEERPMSLAADYYQIHAAIIQAAAALAAGMPQPSSTQLQRSGRDEKSTLMEIYQERYHMAYRAITDVAAAEMEDFPYSLPDEESEL